MTEEQIKELLELLKKALESETVERITISIKPNSPNRYGGGYPRPSPLL